MWRVALEGCGFFYLALLLNNRKKIGNLYLPRFDTNQISMGNDTSSIELLKVNETVLRASNAALNDFVVFDVRTAIAPTVKKITAGDIVVLQSSVDPELGSGEWITEPAGIVSVKNFGESGSLGYAVALRSGQARASRLVGPNRRVTVDLVRDFFCLFSLLYCLVPKYSRSFGSKSLNGRLMKSEPNFAERVFGKIRVVSVFIST